MGDICSKEVKNLKSLIIGNVFSFAFSLFCKYHSGKTRHKMIYEELPVLKPQQYL